MMLQFLSHNTPIQLPNGVKARVQMTSVSDEWGNPKYKLKSGSSESAHAYSLASLERAGAKPIQEDMR